MLKNMKISTKLFCGFGIVISLLVLVMGIYYYTLNDAGKSFQHLLDSPVAIKGMAMKVEQYVLRCKLNANEFLRSRDKKYIGLFKKNTGSLTGQILKLKEAAKKAGLDGMEKTADVMANRVEEYSGSFMDVTAAWEKKGLDRNSGVLGEFRKFADKIREDLANHEIADLKIAFLMMRRYEKDFQRTKNDHDLGKWNKAIEKYKDLLAVSKCDPTALEPQKAALKKYKKLQKEYLVSINAGDGEGLEIISAYNRLRGGPPKVMAEAIDSVFVPGIADSLVDIDNSSKKYFITNDKKYIEKFYKAIQALISKFQNAGVLKKHVADVKEELSLNKAKFDEVVSIDEKLAALIMSMRDSINAVDPLVMKTLNMSDANMKKDQAAENQKAAMLVKLALGLGGIAILIGFVLSYFLTMSIRKPVFKTLAFAKELQNGNLGERLHLDSKDEMGQLAAALDSMADSLMDSQTKNKNNMSSLEELIHQVTLSSDQINSGAGQVASSSESLSQGATEQAASLEEITSSMTQIGAQTKTNAENATQANQIAIAARESSGNGTKQMSGMIKAMNEITESSKEIGKIIKVIDSIAFQTNLLALNAAVEAARAGKYGKGFAVVAQEVRNLAARSAKAAQSTADLIDGAVKRVGNGVTIAENTSKVLEEINDGVEKAADLIGEIAAASNEQAQGVAQVNQGLAQIDSVTQQNTANAEESSAASIELLTQVRKIKELLDRSMGKDGGDPAGNNVTRKIPGGPETAIPYSGKAHTQAPSGWGQPDSRQSPDDQVIDPKQVISLDDEDLGKY